MAPEELERQRIAFALEQGRIAARVALPATLIVAVAAASGTGITGAAAWAALMGGVLFARDRMLDGVSELLATPRALSAARRAFNASSMALALVLGLLPALAFPGMPYELRLGLTLFFCCWICAGMASLGVSPRLYTGYLGVTLGGLSIGWMRSGMLQAPYVIGALLLSGVTLALVQLGPPQADWLSPYGLLLGGKLALVAVLLLLALWNRVRLTAPAVSGRTAPLRRSIMIELVLVVAILGVVAGWRFTPPPRVLAEIAAANAPVSTTLTAGTTRATLTVTPGRPGYAALDVSLSADAEAVTIDLANPGQNIATISRSAALVSERLWRADNVLLPVGGAWSVSVEARTGKFDLKTLKGTLSLPATGMEVQMPPITIATTALAGSLLLTAPAIAQQGLLASCALGQSFSKGPITVTGAYARATPPAAQSAGAYLSISNDGDADDTLVSAATPAARDTMLHSTTMNGQVMEMAPMTGGLPIPAHGSAALDPLHGHLMLTGMSAPFVQGQCIEMTLHFAKAGDLPIEVVVGSYGQSGPVIGDPAAAPSAMEMSGMSSMEGM